MGNSHANVGEQSTPGSKKTKSLEDPRSPSQGLSRTPITVDKIMDESTVSLPFDTSDFRMIDDHVSEDESMYSFKGTEKRSMGDGWHCITVDLCNQSLNSTGLSSDHISRRRKGQSISNDSVITSDSRPPPATGADIDMVTKCPDNKENVAS